MNSWHKYLAEGLGTFVLVFVACGSILANAQGGVSLGLLGVALATGLTLAAMIYATAHVSGGHLNPAVTISMWATKNIEAMTALGYIVAQLVGGVVAALLVQYIFSGVSATYFLGDGQLGTGILPLKGIVVEAVITFFLVWTIFGTIVDKRATPGFGPLCVGLMLAVGIMVGGGYTGGVMNPARSFGPALVSSHWAMHYVYWIGPVVGALLAGLVHHFGFGKKA